MRRSRIAGVVAIAAALVAVNAVAQNAQTPHPPPPTRGAPPPGGAQPGGHGMPPGVRIPPAPPPGGHGNPHGPTAGPGDPHAPPASGDAHGGGEHHLGPINWAFGLFGEKDGVEPDLMTRRKGMPVPFLANLINFAVLAYLGMRFGQKPLTEGLKKRKLDIMREIDEAGKVRAEAEERLAEYEGKLSKIDDELTRIKREYAQQGERDKDRIVQEARERRARMKRDAELLVEQEGKALEKSMLEQTVARATTSAEDLIKQRLASADHDRLADDFLKDVARVGGPS